MPRTVSNGYCNSARGEGRRAQPTAMFKSPGATMSPITFFNRDMFQTARLVPGESKRILVPLARTLDLRLLGRDGPHVPPALAAQALSYHKPWEIFKRLREIQRQGGRVVVIESPLTADSILCTVFCTVLGLGIIFQPFGQFVRYVMGRRLFGVNPDVKSLEKTATQSAITGHSTSVLLKKVAVGVMRGCFKLRGRGWLVLSDFEREEIQGLFPGASALPVMRVPWALADEPLRVGDREYFARFPAAVGKLKLVLWSRLDFELKGIDRMLAGLAAEPTAAADVYHLFLIGPDYAGGLAKVRRRLGELQLEGRVTIVGPDGYTSGDHSPLAMADASILLSRWDGFPRALRESIQLDVPVLVSPETHFADLLARIPCGECAAAPDDPTSVRDAIERLVQGIREGKYTAQAFERARATLDAEALAVSMREQLRNVC